MLPEIKKILYTTDLGESTRPVLKFAVSLAKKHDAKLYLLHVVKPLSDSDSFLIEAYLSEEMAQQAKELAAKMREETSQHVLDKIKEPRRALLRRGPRHHARAAIAALR